MAARFLPPEYGNQLLPSNSIGAILDSNRARSVRIIIPGPHGRNNVHQLR